MIKLKSYRPLITDNFIWEFPTHFKLKTVSQFLSESIEDTTDYISHSAKMVMHNKDIEWFLKKKDSDVIAAIVTVKNVDFENKSATLSVILSADLTADQIDEIAKRLLMFCKEQLKLETLTVENLNDTILKKFTLNGYNTTESVLKRSY